MEKISRPIKPREPDPVECCGQGCKVCVWDIYAEEFVKYEDSMKKYEALISENAHCGTTSEGEAHEHVFPWKTKGVSEELFRILDKHARTIEKPKEV
jgi:hypothetical protein